MAAVELWEMLKEAIMAYPAVFFTAMAVGVTLYHVASGLLAHPPLPLPEPEPEQITPPVLLGEVSEEELKQYDGSHPKKPLLMAIKGQIYDVTKSRLFYGPGGPYALFTGKDASRALAKMSFEPQDLTGDISGLGPFELDALQDWEYKFMSKYAKVGTIKKSMPVEDDNTASTSAATNEATPADNETTIATEADNAPATEEKPKAAVAKEVKEKEAPAYKEAAAVESAKES